MIKLLNLLVETTPGLDYHLRHNLPLSENIYRYSSEGFIQLFTEARLLHRDGNLQLCEEDILLLEETDLGEYGTYEGQKVPLDLPMEVGDTIECEKCDHSWEVRPEDNHPTLCHKCGYDNEKNVFDMKALEAWKSMQEAEYRGKDVPLNKPKRGGSKKFYVYTKNKKGNVVKVSFGAADGGQNLSVKLDDPKRRKAFADRHNCDQKKDKTSPGYWSCRLTRYAKSLGMAKNYSGYW